MAKPIQHSTRLLTLKALTTNNQQLLIDSDPETHEAKVIADCIGNVAQVKNDRPILVAGIQAGVADWQGCQWRKDSTARRDRAVVALHLSSIRDERCA
jgi:hypothetical protein